MLYKDFIILCRQADTLINKLLKGPSTLQGRHPKTLKAAAVHYLAKKKRLHVTLNDLYHIYGVYQPRIIEVEKIIRDLEDSSQNRG